ncbi:hypothetical protein RHMOL_Rhmol10G0238700 [Rhododendron molle]|uniref:Uncharacterized protein n=1 Tax=Rhododendron molle TaxID=49168 RepID=A0ACC0M6S8_RHOML|nr:hypothetical protein RHMOL_Rhmol10G0238700 [Rhododendron molle]
MNDSSPKVCEMVYKSNQPLSISINLSSMEGTAEDLHLRRSTLVVPLVQYHRGPELLLALLGKAEET